MQSNVLLTLVLIKGELGGHLLSASLTYNMDLCHGKHTGWHTKQQRQFKLKIKIITYHSKKKKKCVIRVISDLTLAPLAHL